MSTKTVGDIMNPKLLYIRDGDRVALARRQILEFGVTAVPILDETHRPVGIISLRDLERDGDVAEARGDVTMVKASEPIEAAATKLAGTDFHHLVVVDDKGIAVGMVSAVDFVRALLGLPVRHPKAFDRV
ncbi:MAG: CBS domain-containing protein [Labilithrix sp.]|nr:CBS domain-containing protein [Labilithrix sp.]